MRYQNWDVLLFPADSRVPVQEFDTKCFALDPNSRITTLQGPSNVEIDNFESMTLVPTVTSFVATLERHSPFRISLHSWKKPTGSRILQSYKTRDERVMFEARIFIDGALQAQHSFEDDSAWPEVIEEETRTGKGQPLLFPIFHKDILYQTHWEPGDVLGRIRVVIAEGVVRTNSPEPDAHVTFDRLRDVVTFAFQHAPQDILEYSNIAWPNLRMFGRVPKPIMRLGPIGSRLPLAPPNHDIHSHSPERLPISSRNDKQRSSGFDGFQRLLNAETFSDLQSDPPTKLTETCSTKLESYQRPGLIDLTDNSEDPFIGPQSIASRAWRAQLRAPSHDVSMPDYVSSKTEHSRTHTEMSGVNYPKANFLKHMEEAHPREIVQALSPAQQAQLMKELKAVGTPVQGTHAPSNTPRSLSGLKQPTLAVDRIRDSLGSRVKSGVGSSRQMSDRYCHPKEPRGEHDARSSSSSSNRGQSETALSAKGEECLSMAFGTNRTRSHSNTSKRKRHSNTAEDEKTNDNGKVQMTEDSSPSKGGSQATAACESSATSGGVSLTLD